MKYLVQNPKARLFLRTLDALTRLFPKKKKPKGVVKKVLISNLAHLGDIVLATSVITPLRKKYPDAEIGFLTGSWSAPIVKPLVDHVHCFDHAKLNRFGKNKLKTHWETRKKVLKEIQNYDVLIDLYPYFPNGIYLGYLAGIPERVGFTSGGFGPLLTRSLAWTDRGHMQDHYKALLGLNEPLQPVLKDVSPRKGKYILLHPGTGHKAKQWPASYWRELCTLLLKAGHQVVVTGKGEKDLVNEIVCGLKGVENLCDVLSFDELLAAVKGAQLVICGDTVVSHIATAYLVPKKVIYAGINDWKLWQNKDDVLIQDVPCSPCGLKNGCSAMTCLTALSPQRVFQVANNQGLLDHYPYERRD